MIRRGQAALEFLSTYGFAFLIILVMVGALTYFGVLSPSRLLPQRCLIGAEFECREFQVVQAGAPLGSDLTLNLRVVPRTTSSIAAFGATSAATASGYGYAGAACTFNPAAGPYAPGSVITVTCTLDTDESGGASTVATWPGVGEKLKINYDFSYTLTGGTYPQPVRGEVLASIQ